jgi:hypothetical protein
MAAAPKFHFDDHRAIDLKHANEVLRSFSVAERSCNYHVSHYWVRRWGHSRKSELLREAGFADQHQKTALQ